MRKNKITTWSFVGILILIMTLNILSPDALLTKQERRKLNQFPEAPLTSEAFSDAFEKYALDQMIFRESFRNVKAVVAFDWFRQSDNNDVFIRDGYAFKMEYPYKDDMVKQMADKIQKVYELYLKDKNVYYAIIPDKNYMIRDEDDHLTIDYEKMAETLASGLSGLQAIDLFDVLKLEDYYRSDLHWRQENLGSVMHALGQAMGFETTFDSSDYEAISLDAFYGAYYGEANARVEADVLTYLTSDWLKQTVVTHIMDGAPVTGNPVYDLEKFEGMDGYDVYLSGPTPIVTIENTLNTSGKSLILFRDSFGSSIAPLFMAEYEKVTLIDLRYVTTDQLGDYVDFSDANQDVLFLYNALIINNSSMIR